MKIKQKFKDIKKPDEINAAQLNAYFYNLYNDPTFDIQANSYSKNTTEAQFEARKKQIDILVDELKMLSGNNKFEQLRTQLIGITYKEEDTLTFNAMRKTAEAICYKLARGQVKSKERFNAEIESATIGACSPGAVTNLQKALYATEDSLYHQKYDYIQNLANEYIRNNELTHVNAVEYLGDEVHKANELIHEVSRDYNIVPPIDTNAKYRDLDATPSGNFNKHIKFKEYLDQHFATREGVYAFADHVTSTSLSNLPVSSNFSGSGKEKEEARDAISDVAKECGLKMDDILDYSYDYKNISYKPNYISLLKAGMMRRLTQEGVIETNFLEFNNQQVIESSDAWVVYNKKTQEYNELFSTQELKGLTIS
ncbi:MAG: hypothetical protein WBJ81_04220, partial [Rickettsiales bacterium]